MLKLLKLFTQKTINIDIVFLDEHFGKTVKRTPNYKVPCITYGKSKDNAVINPYIIANNLKNGDIVIDPKNLIYLKHINSIAFGFYIEKNTLFNVAFDLNNNKHLNYLVGVLLSKSILIANNEDTQTAMHITFDDTQNQFTNKVNELLPIVLEKIANNTIKQLSGLNKIDNHQEYINKAIKELNEGWIITEN